MHGAITVIGAIDVEGIDANQSDARSDEPIGQVAREVGVAFEIAIGPPMRVPTRMHEKGFALQSRKLDRELIDRAGAPFGRSTNDAIEIGQGFQLKLREVLAIG